DLEAFLENAPVDFRKETTADFRNELNSLLKKYLQIKEALVEGKEEESGVLGNNFSEEVEKIDAEELSGEALEFWAERKGALLAASQELTKAGDLKGQREQFILLSEEMIRTLLV